MPGEDYFLPATWPTQVVPRGNPTHIQNRPDPYPDPTDPARPLFRPSFTGGQPPLTGGPAVVDQWIGGGPRWFATIDRRWPPLTTVNWWLRRYGRVAVIIGTRLGSESIIGLAENVLDGRVAQAHWWIKEYTACYRLSRRRKHALDPRRHSSQS
ncbi:hypothetical protein Tco_0898283 [Tanacetum coccineum]